MCAVSQKNTPKDTDTQKWAIIAEIERTLRLKITKNLEDVYNTINQLDIIDL